MSKIYEALENAEKDRVAGLNKKPPLLWGRKEEKKTSPALELKEEKKTAPVQGPASTPALAPHEVKKAVPVSGPSSTPASAPKEEKKTSPALEPKEDRKTPLAPELKEEKKIPLPVKPKEEKRTAVVMGPSPVPALESKEEKKTAPVLKPKKERTERSQENVKRGWMARLKKDLSLVLGLVEEKKPSLVMGPSPTPAPAHEEKKKTVPLVGPSSTPPPVVPKEEKKTAPVLEPKGAWTERTVSPPTLKPKEEKKAAPVLKPKQERMERPDPSPAPELSPVGTLWKWFRTKRPAPARTPEPKVEKKTVPLMGPSSTPAPAPKEEKKAAPVLEPQQERMERPALSPTSKPKEEKKTALVMGPSPTPALTSKEEEKTVPLVGPSFTPSPAPKEEKKAAPVVEPKKEKTERYEENAEREWMAGLKKDPPLTLDLIEEERPAPVLELKKERLERHEENEKQRAMELNKSPTPVPAFKEEKKAVPAPQPKEVRAERRQVVHPPKTVSKPVRPETTESDRPLVSLFDPRSLGAEQFRRLRTHVLKLNLTDPPKTIMVTSATEGEGKTFVAANLAAGIAHDLHFHALLVDCDLRNPSLSHWFGAQNGHGLSDYLVGKGNLSELLMKTRMEKLRILTGGSAQEKPAELIGSRKMEALVHELKSRYADRYIIFDTTPLLVTTEPEVLARLVDGILIVVRAGVTPRETVKQAVASLDPKKIMGFVLNDVEFKSSGLASRYFGSDGYYKYGYGKKEAEPQSPSGEVSPLKKRSG